MLQFLNRVKAFDLELPPLAPEVPAEQPSSCAVSPIEGDDIDVVALIAARHRLTVNYAKIVCEICGIGDQRSQSS
jgi:hypothetical protein